MKKAMTRLNAMLMGVSVGIVLASGWVLWRYMEGRSSDEVLSSVALKMQTAEVLRLHMVKQLTDRAESGEAITVPCGPTLAARVSTDRANQDYQYGEWSLESLGRLTSLASPVTTVGAANEGAGIKAGWSRPPGTVVSSNGFAGLGAVFQTATGGEVSRVLHYVRPIRVDSAQCLGCHGGMSERTLGITAPMHAVDWRLNDVVAAQVVSVPQARLDQRQRELFAGFMLTLCGALGLALLLGRFALGGWGFRWPVWGMDGGPLSPDPSEARSGRSSLGATRPARSGALSSTLSFMRLASKAQPGHRWW